MSVVIVPLFTSALSMSAPWWVACIVLNTNQKRIHFILTCDTKYLPCPLCHKSDQNIYDRLERQWRHLNFFQDEAWFDVEFPRIYCDDCGRLLRRKYPWRTKLAGLHCSLRALALSLSLDLPARQAAQQLRCNNDKQLWQSVEHYVGDADQLDIKSKVKTIGINETNLRKGQNYFSVVHDQEKNRLLFACDGKDHQMIVGIATFIKDNAANPEKIDHVFPDMSGVFAQGGSQALLEAQISYDLFHVVTIANEDMDDVQREEPRIQPQLIKSRLDTNDRKYRKNVAHCLSRNPDGWSLKQTHAMHWLQHSIFRGARAWRLKMALQTVYSNVAQHSDEALAKAELSSWLSWAICCHLESFKKLAATLKQRFDEVALGMLNNLSNAYVEVINGLLQQVKRAASDFKTASNFIAIAYIGNVQAQALARQSARTCRFVEIQQATSSFSVMSIYTQYGIDPTEGWTFSLVCYTQYGGTKNLYCKLRSVWYSYTTTSFKLECVK